MAMAVPTYIMADDYVGHHHHRAPSHSNSHCNRGHPCNRQWFQWINQLSRMNWFIGNTSHSRCVLGCARARSPTNSIQTENEKSLSRLLFAACVFAFALALNPCYYFIISFFIVNDKNKRTDKDNGYGGHSRQADRHPIEQLTPFQVARERFCSCILWLQCIRSGELCSCIRVSNIRRLFWSFT